MRYPDGAPPDPNVPYGTTMHDMLAMSMWIGIIVALCLFVAARHGNVMWLKAWSVLLLVLSVGYLGADAAGLIQG